LKVAQGSVEEERKSTAEKNTTEESPRKKLFKSGERKHAQFPCGT